VKSTTALMKSIRTRQLLKILHTLDNHFVIIWNFNFELKRIDVSSFTSLVLFYLVLVLARLDHDARMGRSLVGSG